jgi:hypothetical protein
VAVRAYFVGGPLNGQFGEIEGNEHIVQVPSSSPSIADPKPPVVTRVVYCLVDMLPGPGEVFVMQPKGSVRRDGRLHPDPRDN